MKWGRAQIKREFESHKNWTLTLNKIDGKVFHHIEGYNYNTGPTTRIYGYGYSEKEAWQNVAKECQRKIDWIKEIQTAAINEAQEQPNG